MPTFNQPQVVLFSRDPAAAAAFYGALGFVEVFRTPSAGVPIHIDRVLDGYRLGLASEASTRDDHGLSPVVEGQRAAVILWTDDTHASSGLVGRVPERALVRSLEHTTRSARGAGTRTAARPDQFSTALWKSVQSRGKAVENEAEAVDDMASFGGTRGMWPKALAGGFLRGIELTYALPSGKAGQLGDEGPYGGEPACWGPAAVAG